MTEPLTSTSAAGLQPQRTGMAWTRSLLVTLVSSLLCFRMGFTQHAQTLFVGSVMLLMLAALMVIMGTRRCHADAHQPAPAVKHAAIVCTAAMVVLTSLVLASHFLLALCG